MTQSNDSQSARRVAVLALNQFDTGCDIQDALQQVLFQTPHRAHATDLAFGTVRNRMVIDRILALVTDNPIERIASRLINLLRVAAYELIYCPDTPDYAIVNEAVNLSRSFAGAKSAGFVNAVCRNLTRAIVDRCIPLCQSDPRRILPNAPDTGCLFAETILPDLDSQPAAFLAAAFSLPPWLVQNWLGPFDFDTTFEICLASNRRPGIYLQPNTLKTTAEALMHLFQENRIDADFMEQEQMLRLKSHIPVSQLPGYTQGLFIVQDPTAAAVTDTLDLQPGQVVFDLCAAPGGKTVRMAQRMKDRGTIYAADFHPERMRLVEQNCRRLGITCVQLVPYERLATQAANPPHVDAILLDVPCSNTGVLARRPEVRHRITPAAVDRIAQTQRQILTMAASLSTAGTRIAYSTCSIQTEENQQQIERFAQEHPGFQVRRCELTLPQVKETAGFDCDGGFYSLLHQYQH